MECKRCGRKESVNKSRHCKWCQRAILAGLDKPIRWDYKLPTEQCINYENVYRLAEKLEGYRDDFEAITNSKVTPVYDLRPRQSTIRYFYSKKVNNG